MPGLIADGRRASSRIPGHPLAAAATSSRWRCCPTSLGKQQAKEAGAFEAWQVDRDGYVTEGTSTNAWIVTAPARW